jgi:hypothetical protein
MPKLKYSVQMKTDVIRAFVDGMSYKDISKRFDMPRSTAEKLICDARRLRPDLVVNRAYGINGTTLALEAMTGEVVRKELINKTVPDDIITSPKKYGRTKSEKVDVSPGVLRMIEMDLRSVLVDVQEGETEVTEATEEIIELLRIHIFKCKPEDKPCDA